MLRELQPQYQLTSGQCGLWQPLPVTEPLAKHVCACGPDPHSGSIVYAIFVVCVREHATKSTDLSLWFPVTATVSTKAGVDLYFSG